MSIYGVFDGQAAFPNHGQLSTPSEERDLASGVRELRANYEPRYEPLPDGQLHLQFFRLKE